MLRSVFLVFLLALPWGLLSQEFSGMYSDLDRLESLMTDMQNSADNQLKKLENLQGLLDSSGIELAVSNQLITDLSSITEAQGNYLNSLQSQLAEMQLVHQKQSEYSVGLRKKLKSWRITTIVGITVGVSAGLVAGLLLR